MNDGCEDLGDDSVPSMALECCRRIRNGSGRDARPDRRWELLGEFDFVLPAAGAFGEVEVAAGAAEDGVFGSRTCRVSSPEPARGPCRGWLCGGSRGNTWLWWWACLLRLGRVGRIGKRCDQEMVIAKNTKVIGLGFGGRVSWRSVAVVSGCEPGDRSNMKNAAGVFLARKLLPAPKALIDCSIWHASGMP